MKQASNRRQCLKGAGATGAATVLGFPAIASAAGAGKTVNVGVIGVNSRGAALAGQFAGLPKVNVTEGGYQKGWEPKV